MNREKPVLSAEKQIEIRFSEVDMMGVVWHGSYPLYLEDAREEFGKKYGLSYHRYISEKIYAPVVELDMKYKKPLRYGMRPTLKIIYRPVDAAKIIFDYEILDAESGTVFLIATSVQVFMSPDGNLLWDSPSFYTDWKNAVGVL